MHVHRRRPARVAALLLGCIATCLTFLGVIAASASNTTFTLNGSPSSPVPAAGTALSDWDVQVHVRGPEHWYSLEPVAAQHGPDCGAPPATHTNTSYEGAVFQCRDHVMTALNASDYGVIYLTPNRILDFSAGGAVQFDMSTLRMSTRDWVDIWITPYEDNLALPFDNGDVDLQGIPRRGIHVTMSTFNGETTFRCNRIDNFVQNEVDSAWWDTIQGYLRASGREPSATARDTFRLELSPSHLKFTSTTIPGWTACDTAIASLGFTKGVVQIGHHSYTPTKDDAGVPGTWHWDNISVEPSTPFSIIQADRRYVDGAQTVNFASPAPTGSNLRFSANGIVEVNFGGGWQAARIQPAETNVDRTKSYWMPIPAGTQAVQFRGQDTFNGPFFAKDFSIWSLATSSSPVSANSPSSTPTSGPTNTATASATTPASSTTTAGQTATPVAPTATPTKTVTAPAATPTQSPSSPSTTAGSRITWQGKQWYLNGANLPWYNWGCDFGCGTGSGASSAASKAAIESAFAGAKANGVNVVRWWVFPGDPWQITRDTSGKPTGLNSAIYADFDAAVALAAKYDIYLDFVLFNAPSAVPQSWLTDSNHRSALATTLGPLFSRYANNPRVMTWEVFNEPEWEIWNNQADLASTQAMVKAVAGSVHTNSDALVTVGSAMLEGAGMWVGQGLDYYQAHWYDYMASGGWCARCRDYASVKAEYNLDAPLVLGEFYAGPDSDALSRFEDFYAKGYAGAWAWSLMTNRTSDGMVVDLAAAKTFASRHSDLGPKGSTSAPTPTATSTPKPSTPTAIATPKPATPAPTATAAPSASFKVTTSVSKTFARTGDSQKVTARVTASAATKVLVDIEIYSPSGERVFQKYYDNTAFAKDQTRSFSPSWKVPRFSEKGTYTVKIGVFSPGWGTLHYWNESAATFTVR